MDIKIMPEKYKREREITTGFKLSGIAFLNNLISKTNLWLLLTVSFLGLIILTCFGLWGYQNSLINEKENLEKRLEELAGQRDLEKETNFINLKEGIEDVKKVLKNRLYPSKIFEMLEETTLAQVQFTGLDTDLSQAKLSLETEAVNYPTLAKQIIAFEKDSRIKKVELSGVSLETSGRVGSNLEIELNPDFLYPEPE